MASLSEILNDPNYVNANEETKAAIFTKYAPQDENYTQANAATQAAIRNRFGVEGQPGIGAQGGFDTAVYSGYQGLKGGLAGLAGRLGIMDVEKAKQIQEEAEEKGKKAFKPTEGGWTTDFTGKFAETLGQSVPYMLAPIAAAGVATVAGAPGAVATGVSGLASAIQFAGSNLQRQQERGIELEDTNLTGAIATAIPQAALETLSFRMIPGVQRLFGKAGKEVTEAQAAEIAKQGIVRSTAAYGAQGARTGGIEGMTEVGQQFLERLQAGLTLGDQDAINEFVESFIGGGILGGTISIPGTAMRRDQARQMAAQAPKAPETPAEEQETIETAPPAAPPGAPPVALPEGVPSDVALDQAAMEEEFQRSQGQLPIKPAQATPAQVAQVAPPELELPLGAAPESAEQRTLPPVAQPAQPKIVQPSAEDIIPLNDKGELVETPKVAETAEPVAEGGVAANTILQNRERSSPTSIAQMNAIANKPDYSRVAFSNSFLEGAPVVFGAQTLPAQQVGRQGSVVSAKTNRKIPVQYAVVDADQLIASNAVDGSSIPEYASPEFTGFKAVTNGRIAGLKEGYVRGTMGQYKQDLLADDIHGISPDVINRIKNPILVRIMPQDQVTQDIADESNTSSTLALSATERAKNDANRIDLDGLEFREDGAISPETVRGFVAAMPQSEQQELIDKQGRPTRQAYDRLNAAIFYKAYGNDALVSLAAEAKSVDAANIINGLSQAAPQMAQLAGTGEYDIRPQVVQSAEMAINASRQGQKLADVIAQQELISEDSIAKQVLQLFANNTRSAKKIGEGLRRIATDVNAEASRSQEPDMFGEAPAKVPAAKVVENTAKQIMLDAGYTPQDLNVIGFTKASPELQAEVAELERQMQKLGLDSGAIIDGIKGAQNLSELEYYNRAKSELAKAITQAAKQGGRGDVSQVNVPPPPAELTSPSEEELKAKQEAADKAAADKARADREADAKAKADAERKEIAARSEKAAAEFELGKTAEEDLSGQKDLLATDKKELPELDITGQKTPKGRNPYVVAAGRLFQQGKMSREDFNAYADKYTPIAEVSMDVLEPPTPLQKIVDFFHDPVDAARVEKSIPNGTKVGLRMDVPALNAGLPVVSIHTGKANDDPKTGLPYKTAGKVIKYASTGHIKNVTFAPRSQEKSLNMGINPVKEPLQTAEGEWVNTSPEETLKKVKELSKDSAWTQVGFDPSRRGYFYDRSTGEPVSSASELYQIGRFLLAKDVKYASKDEFLYSRTADQAADTGLTDAENIARVEKVAADATSKWQNKPNIIVINNIQSPEVPQEVRDFVAEKSDGTDTIDEGFFYKGNVYLIAPQLATDADITRVVYHEGLGHFGLRGVFGKSLTPILDQLTVVRPDLIKERADAYGLNLEKPAERRLAAEEALAKLAQTNPKLGFVKRSVAAIRTWLRDNVPGFKNLKMTDDQIIRDYIIPARDFVERGKVRSDQAELNEIRFSKKPSQPNLPGIAGKPKNQTQIPVANPKANWVDPEITWKDTFIRKVADRQNDLKTVQKAITEQVGNLRSNVNAYQIQDLAHGRIQTQTADFLDFEFVPILKEMQEKGITDPELTKYLLARHAEEANKLIAERNKNDPMMQDGGSGMDTDVAKKYLASLNPVKKKALESVAKKVDNILALTREMLEANGIISKEEREGWESMFQHYVPLQREQSDYALPTNSYKSVGKFSKSRTGSIGKSVIDILANVGINREVAIVRIEKERVKRAVYGLAVTNPNPEIWKAVSPDAIKNKTVLAQELREMGISAADVANILSEPTTRYFNKETGQVESRVDQMKRYADFVLPVKINGKDRFIFFNPKNPRAMAMVTALKDMDVKALEGAVASVANVTRFFAAVNTQYNLVFGLFNFARDLQGAMFNLTTTEIADKKADVAKGAMKALPEIYQALRERNAGETPSSTADGSWYDFISNGGKVGYRDQFAKVQESATLVEREFAKLDRGAAKRRAYALLNWVSNVNDVLENAVRLSSYRVALDKFKSEAKGKISDAELSAMKANAAEIAKNITVNFNTKGNATGMVGALYAFTNASIRGTARLIETVDPRTSRGRKIMGALVTLGAVQAVALAMAGFGDDEPSEFIKQKSLVIPLNLLGIEGKKYFLIPMPYGLNVFPNLGRLMVDGSMNIAKGRGVKDQVANAIGMIFTAFNPIGGGAGMLPYAPTILDPVAAIIQNRDAFDRPIYREDRSTKPTPGYLRSRDPSSFANWFAEFINTMTGGTAYTKGLISPTADHINYLAEQVGGGVYREGSRAVKYVADKVTGNETPDYRVPLAGKLVGDLDSPAAISQKFYKNVIRMSEHEEEIKGRISSRQSTSQYMKDNPEASLWRRANSLENELSKINRRRRELIAQDAPKEQIKRIEDQRTRMMRQFNDAVKQREAK
jgi:hypothetical protein